VKPAPERSVPPLPRQQASRRQWRWPHSDRYQPCCDADDERAGEKQNLHQQQRPQRVETDRFETARRQSRQAEHQHEDQNRQDRSLPRSLAGNDMRGNYHKVAGDVSGKQSTLTRKADHIHAPRSKAKHARQQPKCRTTNLPKASPGPSSDGFSDGSIKSIRGKPLGQNSKRREECVQVPARMTRSAPQSPFEPPEVRAVVRATPPVLPERQKSAKIHAGSGSSGESRINACAFGF